MNQLHLPDSHFHLHISAYSPEDSRAHMIPRGITCATSPEDWNQTLECMIPGEEDNTPAVLPYLGIHPWFINDTSDSSLGELKNLLEEHPECGIGEIGLDKVKKEFPMDTQRHWFREQLKLASNLRRPVSIHCVKAWGALTEELSSASFPLPLFYIHAFGGSPDMMKEIIALGGMISFSPFTIREGRKYGKECLKSCPGDALLLDTDFPYSRGQAMDEYPPIIENLYATAARVRKTTTDELRRLVQTNLLPFLQINKTPHGETNSG